MMSKVLKTLAALIALSLLFMFWYSNKYSMSVAESFEVNDSDYSQRLLIATQGSDFKKLVVEELIERYADRPIYVKVIDVSGLAQIKESDWTAIVILHTWEIGEPQPDAEAFVKSVNNLSNVYTVSTSGSGDEIMEDVDGITGASDRSKVYDTVESISTWLDLRFMEQTEKNLITNDN